jgi:hypothetical protein
MRLALAVLTITFVACAHAYQTSSKDEAQALLQKAHDVTDIRSLGPLYLSATFEIKRWDGTYSGKYHLLWVNEQKWRDEVVMGNYVQVRIGLGEQVYQSRTLPDPQHFADSVTGLVELSPDFKIWPGEKSVGVRSDKRLERGVQLECAVFRNAQGVKYSEETFCSIFQRRKSTGQALLAL